MKKYTILGVLVALLALSAPSLAATAIDFSGYLKVFHANHDNYLRSADSAGRDSESYFINKFQLNVDIMPTDDISIHWVMRSIWPERWGRFAAGNGGGPGTSLYTRSLHARIAQPWGTVYIGRVADNLPGNVGGLYNLGYRRTWGSEFLYGSNVFDLSAPVDSVAYDKDFDNGFGLIVFYSKDAIDPRTGSSVAPMQRRDHAKDHFGVEPRYQWDGGGVALGIEYVRDMTRTAKAGALLANDATADSDYAVFVNPAVTHAWGPFSLSFEGKVGFGRTSFRDDLDPSRSARVRRKGLGLYLDANYDYGAGDVSLLGFYADGTGRNDKSSHGLVGLGDFSPFLVAFNRQGFGNGTWANSNNGWIGSSVPNAGDRGNDEINNIWGAGLLGNHSLNDAIRLNYGIGAFRLVNQTYANQSKNLGLELDAGATFQIIDNLSFETQFGYLFNGDAYKVPASSKDPKNTFSWMNVMAITF
ncbi:MAG: hypothetical protein LBP92_12550 [Deltaproteobacteria bacterium]|jgi:hypothetical protein|nr:hypothetical protein [Deltaproteobacteria bacterium]